MYVHACVCVCEYIPTEWKLYMRMWVCVHIRICFCINTNRNKVYYLKELRSYNSYSTDYLRTELQNVGHVIFIPALLMQIINSSRKIFYYFLILCSEDIKYCLNILFESIALYSPCHFHGIVSRIWTNFFLIDGITDIYQCLKSLSMLDRSQISTLWN